MQTDLTTLKERVIAATRASPVASQVQDVLAESDRDDEGVDFLRVIVQGRTGDKALDRDLAALLEAIETTVGAVDDRYPSVRFLDAA